MCVGANLRPFLFVWCKSDKANFLNLMKPEISFTLKSTYQIGSYLKTYWKVIIIQEENVSYSCDKIELNEITKPKKSSKFSDKIK